MNAIRKTLTALLAGLTLAALAPVGPAIADPLKELRLDYATYSPTSLVVRKMGWMEEAFKADGVTVKWVQSPSSANALDFLKKGSLDFGSTAGLAAVLARVDGNPIKCVYIFSKPEWTALVVAKDSPIASVADLKGKKIAANRGTDPYLFLLRALARHGLNKADVEVVQLAHVLGRKALEAKEVDAWAGLDPHMAASELEAGSRLLYRNADFNTYGFLNTTEAFAASHPDAVKRVIGIYEKARVWLLANPEEATALLSEQARISPAVARQQLARNDFTNPVPGSVHLEALKAAAPILADEQLVTSTAVAIDAIDKLVDGSFAKDLK